MKLLEYIKENSLQLASFARRLGIARYTLYRYIKENRLPPPKTMAAIFSVTKGMVQPNDFYDLKKRK